MLGHFTITNLDGCGISQKDANRLTRKELNTLPHISKTVGQNQVFDNFVAYTYFRTMGGPSVSAPYNLGTAGQHAALGFISLLTTDGDPTYTESSNENVSPYAVTDSIGGGASNAPSKRFVEDQLERTISSGTGGYESVKMSMSWQWGPNEGNSANIKSLGVFFSENANAELTVTQNVGLIARIRLKDSMGVNKTITKTAGSLLVVDYELTLVSV